MGGPRASTWGELRRNGEATGKVKVTGSWKARTPQTVGLLLRATPPETHWPMKATETRKPEVPTREQFPQEDASASEQRTSIEISGWGQGERRR